MINKALLARVKPVSQLPLNRIAARFLDEPPLATEPAVLTLMRWGLENGIRVRPLAPGYPDQDSLMAQITAMTRWQPRNAVRFLTNPESPEDAVLHPEELDAQPDAMEAASLLLENLYNAMVANAP